MGKQYYKHPGYGHVYGESSPSPVGRLVWPSLVKPKDPPPPKDGQPAGTPRFEVTILLQKDSPSVIKFVNSLKTMTDEMLILFNKGRSGELGTCKLFGKYGDGDEADHEKYPYYKGMWVLTARNAQKDKFKILSKPDAEGKVSGLDASAILGGMKGRVRVTPIITAHGISYKLEGIQLTEDDGVRFGGAAIADAELFDACSDDSDSPAPKETPAAPPAAEVVAAATTPSKKGKAAALDLL